MERFSWSDNLRAALSPCLTCLHSRRDEEDDDERQQYNHHRATNTHGPDYVPRARLDELEGLLADSDDAETLSLHSNLGRDDTRRRKHHRPRKGIRLFGFDLFGKPPIQLPEDDDVADGRVQRSRTISASTMDSDASPLDPSMIDQLSAARVAEGEAQRDAERRAKDERRRRRRDKKAAREAALALALDRNQDGDEFEGFPVRCYAPSSGIISDVTLYRVVADLSRLQALLLRLATTNLTTLDRSPKRSLRLKTRRTLMVLTSVQRPTPSVPAWAAQVAQAQTRGPAPLPLIHVVILFNTTTSPSPKANRSQVRLPPCQLHTAGRSRRDSPSRVPPSRTR